MRAKIDPLWKDCKIGDTYHIVDLSSMSRIEQHAKNGMVGISAMRGGMPVDKTYEEFTPEEKAKYQEDVKITKELERDIRALGYGFIKTLGGFIETDENTGKYVNANEFSFLIPYDPNGRFNPVDFVIEFAHLADQYGQQSILVAGFPWIADGQARYISTTYAMDLINNKEEILKQIDENFEFSKTHYNKELNREERPYYTQIPKLGGRNFTFDSESKQNLSKIVGVHKPIGAYGHRSANTKKEIYNI